MIVFEPRGGLCNRMRALGSAIALSKNINKPLQVIWRRNHHLNCNFEALFLIPPSIQNLIQVDSTELLEGCSEMLPVVYDQCIDDSCIRRLVQQKYNFEELSSCKAVFIWTGDLFYKTKHLFREFVPIDPLQKIIQSYAKDFKNVFGVHIRRTDNVRAIRYSPMAKYIELMEKEIAHNGSLRFFLATDSPDDEAQLKMLFPDRIITHPKRSLNRNDPLAIEDALIDLFCLSKCQKLIGSHWSSFTNVAAEINGIDKTIVIVGNPAAGFDFNDLEVGQSVKVQGRVSEDGAFAAREIKLGPNHWAVFKGVIRSLDRQENMLCLLNREFVVPNGIPVINLQRDVIGWQDLKAGDIVQFMGRHSAQRAFELKKIEMQKATDFDKAEVCGDIDKIDREKKTLEVLGFTVVVGEDTKIY